MCGLVHGDVSINNILIVRLLPNIVAAMPPGMGSNLDNETVDLPSVPCTQEGLSIPLLTGGSLIDFDYSREKDISSVRTSVSLNLLLLLIV